MKTQSRAFTLIELLVVIAIIAILAAILFPVFAQAKAAAKRTSDLSNVKNISMGLMIYLADADDSMPLSRSVPTGADWWTSRMLSWKDATLPYIKNGGQQYGTGQTYNQTAGGGIFASPIADSPWSNLSPIYWGYPPMTGTGDETTRFPRSYALSTGAGYNETGNTIIRQWQVNTLTGGGGSATTLGNSAGTIMIVPVRYFFTDAWPDVLTYQCTPGGIPAGGQTTSCVQGTKNKGANWAFYDGHAKNIPAVRTITDDNWGYYAWCNQSSGNPNCQRDNANYASQIQEWR